MTLRLLDQAVLSGSLNYSKLDTRDSDTFDPIYILHSLTDFYCRQLGIEPRLSNESIIEYFERQEIVFSKDNSQTTLPLDNQSTPAQLESTLKEVVEKLYSFKQQHSPDPGISFPEYHLFTPDGDRLPLQASTVDSLLEQRITLLKRIDADAHQAAILSVEGDTEQDSFEPLDFLDSNEDHELFGGIARTGFLAKDPLRQLYKATLGESADESSEMRPEQTSKTIRPDTKTLERKSRRVSIAAMLFAATTVVSTAAATWLYGRNTIYIASLEQANVQSMGLSSRERTRYETQLEQAREQIDALNQIISPPSQPTTDYAERRPSLANQLYQSLIGEEASRDFGINSVADLNNAELCTSYVSALVSATDLNDYDDLLRNLAQVNGDQQELATYLIPLVLEETRTELSNWYRQTRNFIPPAEREVLRGRVQRLSLEITKVADALQAGDSVQQFDDSDH